MRFPGRGGFGQRWVGRKDTLVNWLLEASACPYPKQLLLQELWDLWQVIAALGASAYCTVKWVQ